MTTGLLARAFGFETGHPVRQSVLEGALLMIAATFFLAASNAMVRALAPDIHPFQTGFFLNLIGLLTIWPWVRREGLGVFRMKAPVLHLIRGVTGAATLMAWMWALSHVELAKATAISFTAPVFSALAAILFLRERVTLPRLVALAAGFLGMLVILRPGALMLDTGTVVALFSAAGMAVAYVTTKLLLAHESASSVIVNTAVILTPLSFVPAVMVWNWPGPSLWLMIAAMGLLGTMGRVLLTAALRAADASAVLPFDFGRLIFIAAIGMVFFGEQPDLWTFLGALIIAVSAIGLVRAERRLSASALPPHPAAIVPSPAGDECACSSKDHP